MLITNIISSITIISREIRSVMTRVLYRLVKP